MSQDIAQSCCSDNNEGWTKEPKKESKAEPRDFGDKQRKHTLRYTRFCACRRRFQKVLACVRCHDEANEIRGQGTGSFKPRDRGREGRDKQSVMFSSVPLPLSRPANAHIVPTETAGYAGETNTQGDRQTDRQRQVDHTVHLCKPHSRNFEACVTQERSRGASSVSNRSVGGNEPAS